MSPASMSCTADSNTLDASPSLVPTASEPSAAYLCPTGCWSHPAAGEYTQGYAFRLMADLCSVSLEMPDEDPSKFFTVKECLCPLVRKPTKKSFL